MSTEDPADPDAALRQLDREECLRLLATARLGRIAAVLADSPQPVIRPVNFIFDAASQSVLIRSGSGSKLHALLRANRAAFEIDGTEGMDRLSWSVIALGAIEEISDPSELRRIERLGLEPAPGRKNHWLRLRVDTVSGRAFPPQH